MKILVCGGRDCYRRDLVFDTLNSLHAERGITGVIEGGAPGIDNLAYSWAIENGLHLKTYRADWNTHGKAAGPIRNRTMLADGNPDLVVAINGGRGTAHMVGIAKAAGVEVIEVRA